MEMLKKCVFSVLVLAVLSVPAWAESSTQWMSGYYGLEGDPDTAALYHLDADLGVYPAAIDDSGHGRDINYRRNPPATVWTAASKFNGGFYNDGTNSGQLSVWEQAWYPSAGIGLGTGPSFTVEMWIKPDGQQADGTVLMGFLRGDPGVQMRYYGGGKLQGLVNVENVGTVFLEGQTVITPDVWHHIALTRDNLSGDMKLYLDGDPVAETTAGTGESTYWNTAYPMFQIGSNEWNGGDVFKGNFDEIRLSSVARTFVPEPATLLLLSAGGLLLRRRRNSK